jgi:hypothetical protein
MVQSYKALSNGVFSPSEQQPCYAYTITYYTFFGLLYREVDASCEGYGH